MQTKQRLAEEGIQWQDELSEYQPIDDYCDVSFYYKRQSRILELHTVHFGRFLASSELSLFWIVLSPLPVGNALACLLISHPLSFAVQYDDRIAGWLLNDQVTLSLSNEKLFDGSLVQSTMRLHMSACQ